MQGWRASTKVWTLALVAVWALQAAVLVPGQVTWFDEGNYSYKGWLFLTGRLAPYQEVWTEYPPGAYFFPGLAHALLPPEVSFHAARALNALFVAGAALLAFCAARRLGGVAAGVLAAAFFLVNPWNPVLWLAAPYGPGNFFLALAALGIVRARDDPLRGRLIAVSALVACVFLRANYAPAAILGGLWLLATGRRWSEHAAVIGVGLAGAVGFLACVRWNFTTALAVLGAGNPHPGLRGARIETLRQTVGQWALFKTLVVLQGAIVLTALGVAAAAVADGSARRVITAHLRRSGATMFLLFAYVALVLFHALALWSPLQKYYPSYATYFRPWMAVPLAALLVGVWPRTWPRGARRLLVAVLVVPFVVHLTGQKRTVAFRRPDLAVLQEVGRAVARETEPDDMVWSMEEPYFLLAARRTGPPALVNGKFSHMTGEDEPIRAAHRWNTSLALEWLDRSVLVIWSTRLEKTLRRFERFHGLADAIQKRLERDFRLVEEIDPGVPTLFRRWTTDARGRGVSRGWVRLYKRERVE
jgi:hypothetical protein